MRKFPIGISDFKRVRKEDYYFVDKSLFIEEIMNSSGLSILIPRPRRFGKTINMSMLNAFFDVTEKNAALFEGLKIRESETWKHQGKYPVIFLTFKDVKESTFEASIDKIRSICSKSLKNNLSILLDTSIAENNEIEYFQKIANKTASNVDLGQFLATASETLEKLYNQKVVILVDEYDSCIIKSWNEGYQKDMIDFMRDFLSGGYKDNDALYKGVITGILRVAKESIFSGLNNLKIFSVLNHPCSDKFGLTELEVKKLLSDIDETESFETVKHWYNGYNFGNSQVYNPWSVINFADAIDEGPQPYWVNTSANELIEELLTNANADLEKKLTGFIDNQVMTCEIEETTIFKDLETGHEKTVLGLLLFNGYLTTVAKNQQDNGFFEYGLKIPNHEVKMVYTQMLERLLQKSTEVSESSILTALLEQNTIDFEDALSQYFLTSFSFHDVQHKGALPEKVYHAFVLGLMAHLSNKFVVKSNPETGLGRADLLIYPKDNKDTRGWILEFKKHKKSSPPLKKLAQEAMHQIHSSKYLTTLNELGKTEIMLVGVAFDGKEVACVME